MMKKKKLRMFSSKVHPYLIDQVKQFAALNALKMQDAYRIILTEGIKRLEDEKNEQKRT